MCAAIPVAMLLLAVFVALTAVRLSDGHCPNAGLLTDLMEGSACGAREQGKGVTPFAERFPIPPSSPRSLSPS